MHSYKRAIPMTRPYIPRHLIEYIGQFCDIDTKRALGIKPGKVKYDHIQLKFPLVTSIPIADSGKTLDVWYDDIHHVVRYTIKKDWLPSASYHVALYDDHGQRIVCVVKQWCE